MDEAKKIIENLRLQPLLGEGGYFRRSYETEEELCPGKKLGSAIYYLLTENTFSSLHRLPSDEVYHFYLGDPVELLLLAPNGESKLVTLGQDLDAGMQVQAVVPKGWYQGSRLKKGGSYALLGTTMSPGYTDDDYVPGDREALIASFPQWKARIEELTQPPAYPELD